MYVMRDAHQWLELEGRRKEADAIAAVLDFRLDAASAAYRIKLDLENIEELFSLASAKSRTLTQQIQLAIAATLDYKIKTAQEPIVKFQSRAILPKVSNSWRHERFDEFITSEPFQYSCPAYEYFLKCMLGDWNKKADFRNNSLITFNYDLLVENALKGLSIPFTYGFNSKGYDADAVELLKLHGSVNWAKKESSTVSYTVHNSYDDLLNTNQTPQLVPPTWRKIFTGPLRQVWDKSLKSLEQATRIIVIGFSIPPTDNHFKYLLAAGLQHNISLREIVFVNPDSDQIRDRADNLFGGITNSSSVKIIGCNFIQFVSQGINKGAIGDFGRKIPPEIQNVSI